MSDRGRFIWYELLTKDPAAAREFYTRLMGLGHTVWQGDDMTYEMLTVGDAPRYGLMQLPERAAAQGAPSHWLGHVYVPDRDDARAQAVGLGGCELVSMDIPDAGSFSVMGDPQGAVFAVYEPSEEPEPDRPAARGEVGWHELATTDYEAAFEFYSSMFGWELMEDMDMGEYGIYRIFGRNGHQLGGMWNKPPEMPVAAWLYYHTVDSIEDAAEAIPRLGGSILNGPMEVPGGGRIIQAVDPTGATFALFQPPTPED